MLRNCDAAEISANLTGFISVLMEWEHRERGELVADSSARQKSNGEDA
jgi:hypothetical protein